MQGLVTVFGGSGFVGRYVVRALAQAGWRVRVAVRRPNHAPELKVVGDVGQVELFQANLRNPDSIGRALDGATAVVNLVGVLWQTGPQTFDALQAKGATDVAQAAAARGIGRFIQISAIGADANGTSKYARSKAEGEAAVRTAIPSATIIRPSVVFGPQDTFFNKFAGMSSWTPALPLIGGGQTRFQPIYAEDVGAAVAAALASPSAAGQTFEIGGPGVYTFKELMEITLKETGRKRALVPLPFWAASLVGLGGDLVALTPFPPPVTRDQVELLRKDNVVSGKNGLETLGVLPTALEAVLPTYLWKYRNGGQFAQHAAGNA